MTSVTNDFDLDDAAQWSLAGDWSDNGDGTFSKTGSAANWGSWLEQSFAFDNSKKYASVVNITDNPGDSQGIYFDAQPGNGNYDGSISPRRKTIFASLITVDSGSTSFRYQGGLAWEGTISQAGLFDVTGIESMPVHIVMVAGQSNAIGFGTDLNGDYSGTDSAKDNWHPRIWCMPGGSWNLWGADQSVLNIANDPIQFQPTINNEVSPAMAAARRIVAAHPNHRVVLVPVARPATSLVGTAAHWNPNTTETVAARQMFRLLKEGYNAAVAALGGATVASVSLMFSQGEADAIPDVVYFDLAGAVYANPSPDTVHFTTEGQRIRGDYAGQLLAGRLGASAGTWASPRVQN